jgi:hypothetical protein
MASSMTTNNSTWTTPRTYTTGELITKAILDVHIRDNLNALKTPASFHAIIDESSDFTTASTSFTNISSSFFSATLTTGGGDMIIGFQGSFAVSSAMKIYLELTVDGVVFAGNDGLLLSDIATTQILTLSFTALVTGLSAASHTFAVQWKNSAANTTTLFAGAGTSTKDVHPQFWGKEQ